MMKIINHLDLFSYKVSPRRMENLPAGERKHPRTSPAPSPVTGGFRDHGSGPGVYPPAWLRPLPIPDFRMPDPSRWRRIFSAYPFYSCGGGGSSAPDSSAPCSWRYLARVSSTASSQFRSYSSSGQSYPRSSQVPSSISA